MMKKGYLLKYTIFLLVCFFSIIITSVADQYVNPDPEYFLGHGVNSVDVAAKLGATKIINVTPGKGEEYIDIQCPIGTANCKVILPADIADSLDERQNYIAVVTFEYNVSGTDETYVAYVNFNINAFRGAWIWDSPMGICDYSNGWELESVTRSNGQTFKYYKSTSPNSVLPNCTVNPSNVIPVEFKGWMRDVDNDTGISHKNGQGADVFAVGQCKGVVDQGTRIEIHENYSPCFETKNYYVRLSASPGKVESSEWTLNKVIANEYYHMSSNADGTVALPNLVYSGFNEGKTLQCWKKNGSNECLAPGTVVKTDGSAYVAVTNTEHKEYSYYKSVRVNDAVVFAVEGMKSCSIASGQPSGYIDVSSINGDCMVAGLKETSSLQTEDESGNKVQTYIEVDIELENGSKKIYKFTVESNAGVSAGGNGEFIVNPNVNSGEENSYTDSSGFKTNSCNSYEITATNNNTTIPGSNIHSNIYGVSSQCSGDNNHYVALCLDPGREAPESVTNYEKVTDLSSTKTDLGKLVSYLVKTYNLDEFDNLHSSIRMAAHVSARIVAIQSGMGATSGIIYSQYQQPFYDTVDDINEHKPTTPEQYASIIRNHLTSDVGISKEIGKILASYKSNQSVDSNGFERTIDSNKVEQIGNGYRITYKGTITAPANATDVQLLTPSPNPNNIHGVSFEVSKWEKDSTTDKGETIYNYEIKISAGNTLDVVPPINEEEKLSLSFKITYGGGQTASNVFLAQPVGAAGALQRMLVFNTTSTGLFIYFNIAPNDCELPGLDYRQCTGADSCPSTVFNAKLFKASGCCRYVADEVTYAYVAQNVCAAKCTTSTMTNVCDYSSLDNLAELYEIKEGAEYNGSATGEGGGYANAIATCVVNVDRDIRNDDKSLFEKEDDNGNSISVKSYESNTYCRINCKEDWQISMDGFGSYVGEKAIAAGYYFQIENDIFISGKRTCYTNYVDYDRYMNDLERLSVKIILAYNEYSNLSHSYSDIKLQVDEDGDYGDGLTSSPVYRKEHTRTYSKTCKKDTTTTPATIKCTTSTSDSSKVLDTYYDFSLNTDGDFEGTEGDAAGKHQTYNNNPGNDQEWGPTENRVTKGSVDAYSVPEEKITCTVKTNTPPDSAPEGCYTSATDTVGTWSCKRTTEDEFVSCTGDQVYHADGDQSSPSDSDKSGAFDYLSDKMMERLEGKMNGPRGTVSSLARQIKDYIDEMYKCQHFQLVNTTDDNSEYASTKRLKGQYYDEERSYTEITTAFDPSVNYEYAEDAFMTILLNNKENYLERYDEKNEAIYLANNHSEGYKNATNASVGTTIKLKASDKDGEGVPVNLARNRLQFKYYDIDNASNKWSPTSDEGRNYDNGAGSPYIDDGIHKDTLSGDGKYTTKVISVCGIRGDGSGDYVTTTNSKGIESSVLVGNPTPEWKGGSCFTTYAPYLKANYIKASIENSSFYKNQGTWYENVKDVKAHGEGLEAALNSENANNNAGYNVSKELDSGRWSPIGLMNVFPISITTPRNLYTYTYTFKDIGSHSGGELGRIMGSETAIIGKNNRTCFYEVYEEICLCCGDKINTYVYNDTDENDLIQQVVSASGYPESDVDKMEENEGGTLAFATTTVNLSDIDVDENLRPVATNWSDNSPFAYGGEYNLSTSKGEQLKNAIESQGEKIYSDPSNGGGPEYAYYLTPTTLTKIREYNDAHGYEVNLNNLKVYGRYSIAALKDCSNINNDSCWTTSAELMNNEVINFQHYGSVFLEDLANDPNIVKSGTLARAGNDNVCLVVDKQFNAETINNLVKNQNCRWIDFVENLSDNSGKGETSYVYPYTASTKYPEQVTYFRLAFK